MARAGTHLVEAGLVLPLERRPEVLEPVVRVARLIEIVDGLVVQLQLDKD